MSNFLLKNEAGPKRAVFYTPGRFFNVGVSANAAGIVIPFYTWQPLSENPTIDPEGLTLDANGDPIPSPFTDWAPCHTNTVRDEVELTVNNPRTLYGAGYWMADIPATGTTKITVSWYVGQG